MCVFPIIPWRKYDSQRPLFGGDFLGQILAADSLPGAFVHSRFCGTLTQNPPLFLRILYASWGPIVWPFLRSLAHQNRSDFCDLRLRCPSRTPEIARFPKQDKAMLHCDLRVRWKVASDLRFRAAISEPKTSSFSGISGDLAPSTRKSLAIAIQSAAIVRFWCAKVWPFLRSSARAPTIKA